MKSSVAFRKDSFLPIEDMLSNSDKTTSKKSSPSLTPGSSPVSFYDLSYSSNYSELELIQLRWELNYYKKHFQAGKEREEKLEQEIEDLKAKLLLREHQLFGKKTEKDITPTETEPIILETEKKKRGQQPGSKGHGRRDYSHLEEKEEIWEIPKEECCCGKCGLPFQAFPETEDSKILEVKVQAYVRKIRRKRYQSACECQAGIITAPGPPKLIPKGLLGTSIWVEILLSKFYLMQPTYRFLENLKINELDLAMGTVTDGLKKIAPLFIPLYEAIREKCRADHFWNADETRWQVFVPIEGKIGCRWYMWVFASPQAVIYVLDPTRSAKVPRDHFPSDASGFLMVDRYSAYKAMAKERNIILIFCWVHVRRDFVEFAKKYPKGEEWAFQWVDDIGNLYHLNKLRLEAWKATGEKDSAEYRKRNLNLKKAVFEMEQQNLNQLKEEEEYRFKIDPENKKWKTPKEKVLQSLKNHWSGLTMFVEYPFLPMDNNRAEQKMRIPVLGRNAFFGSGSLWSGGLLMMLLSFFQTGKIFNINSKQWLTAYLEACAQNQGPPTNIDPFLPWNFSEKGKLLEFTGSSVKSETQDSEIQEPEIQDSS